MRNRKYIILFVLILTNGFLFQCSGKKPVRIETGAEQTEKYLPLLKNKKVAVVANHTTNINGSHLVDSLLSLGINITKIFSPEHGFRGKADAGEHVKNYTDSKTGLPVISLYGSSKKPKLEDLNGVDLVVFDLQDVGVRFYTYISTMHYVMEACAEKGVEMLILDRPNPNGYFIDGPVLDTAYSSFVGMHPVPIVHGMTIAEYAQMINEEGWLKEGLKCNLSFISCKNYTHDSLYQLPINPSPNLQNMLAVYLYPSLGFFEGTSFSAGRGTEFPFQVYGSPDYTNGDFSFTPVRIDGASKYPKHRDDLCYGVDLRNIDLKKLIKSQKLNLEWILDAYQNTSNKDDFFNAFFYNISGNKLLRKQIEQGKTEQQIRESWIPQLYDFKQVRKNYLIYQDFE
jgi:uncharacterized protein YbbC (DUF1343 family)